MSDTSASGAAVKKSADIKTEVLKGARDTRMQVLVGPDDNAHNFIMRKILMEQAGSGMPAHTNAVEHEQYVLRGRARVGIGEHVFEVGADDTLFIPAGTPHWYDVIEPPFEFLCVVPNTADEVRLVEQATDAD